jgi:hypothetical protein
MLSLQPTSSAMVMTSEPQAIRFTDRRRGERGSICAVCTAGDKDLESHRKDTA